MEVMQYLEAYDAISDILVTIGYNDKSQPTKEAIINALTSVKNVTDEFEDKDRIKIEVQKLLYAINGIRQLPEGSIVYEIKTIIIDSICNIRHEIVKYFFEEYYDKDIDDALEYEEILRNMVSNYYCLEE